METCLQLISSEAVNIQMMHVIQMSLQTFKHFLGKQAKHSAAITNINACPSRLWLLK